MTSVPDDVESQYNPRKAVPNVEGFAERAAALNDPGVREKLAGSGIGAAPGTAENFGAVIRNELAGYGPVVKSAGIKLD